MKYLNIKLLLIFWFVLILVLGCTNRNKKNNSQTSEIVHPTQENIPPDSAIVDIISAEIKDNTSSQLYRLVKQLAAARKISVIGSNEEDEKDLFGKIEDIVVDRKGHILVLDQRLNKIKAYNTSGNYLYSLSGEGQGPGEIRAGEALDIDKKSGKLFILDRYLKLDIFEESDSTYEYKTSTSIPIASLFGCQLDSMYAFTGAIPGKDGFVHPYSFIKDKFLKSIGHTYKSSSQSVISNLSYGPVGCNKNTDMFVTAIMYFPYIYGYTSSGKQKWITKIDDFSPQKLVERKPGVIFQTLSTKEPFNSLANIIPIANTEFMLIQVVNYGRTNFPNYDGVSTYLISSTTGKGAFVTKDLPIIYFATKDKLYGAQSLPFPQVKIFTYR